MYSGRSPTRPGTWAILKGSKGPGSGRNPYADSHGGPGSDPRVVRPRDVRPGAAVGRAVRPAEGLGEHPGPAPRRAVGHPARGRPAGPLAPPAGPPGHSHPPGSHLLPRPVPAGAVRAAGRLALPSLAPRPGLERRRPGGPGRLVRAPRLRVWPPA